MSTEMVLPLARRSAGQGPDDPRWLGQLIARSPLLPDAALRRCWLRVLPYLPVDLRYEIAAALLEAETDPGA